MQVQVLVTFKEGTSDAVVQAHLLTLRRNADVAQVELVVDPVSRKPTEDGHLDTTVRAGHVFVKGPRGELLDRLTDAERDVVDMLTDRVRKGLGPVRSQKGLLEALQQFHPEKWATKRGVSSATAPYSSAYDKLVATEWRLIGTPGVFYFECFVDGGSAPS